MTIGSRFASVSIVLLCALSPCLAGATPAAPATQPATNVLYVEGPPRWEYRYVKNALLRSPAVNISCLLMSADERFEQEADPPVPDMGPNDPRTGVKFPGRLSAFPDTLESLRRFDVMIIGDIDLRTLSDTQLRNVNAFVKAGGGLVMIAGEKMSPERIGNSPLAEVLPVTIAQVDPKPADDKTGYEPNLTDAGKAQRFLKALVADPKHDDESIPFYWYRPGVTPKERSVVLAEHPTAKASDGKAIALVVGGTFGEGKTLFIGFDDSWRLRHGNGRPRFTGYWEGLVSSLRRPAPMP